MLRNARIAKTAVVVVMLFLGGMGATGEPGATEEGGEFSASSPSEVAPGRRPSGHGKECRPGDRECEGRH